MTEHNIDYAAIAAAAAENEDQTQTTTGGFEPPKVGVRVARLREYIELGMHPQTYNGEAKPAADEVRLTFELMGPEDLKKYEVVNEDGSKTQVEKFETISVSLTKKFNEKAGYTKLFQTMRKAHGDVHKHMAAMLGLPFVIEVVHNKSKDGKRTYANIKDSTRGWLIMPPFKIDAVAGTSSPYAVPDLMGDKKVFIWDLAADNPGMFSSLFIAGTRERTVKDEAGIEKKVQESKNWLQEKICGATNFVGSPLHSLLSSGETNAVVSEMEKAPVAPPSTMTPETGPRLPVEPAPVPEAATVAPEAPTPAPTPAPAPDAVEQAEAIVAAAHAAAARVAAEPATDPVAEALLPVDGPSDTKAPEEKAPDAPLSGLEQMKALGLI